MHEPSNSQKNTRRAILLASGISAIAALGSPLASAADETLDPDVARLVGDEGSQTNAALKATFGTTSSARPVGQGELVISAADYGLPTDGQTPASQAISAAIAAAPAGATVLVPPGTYRMTNAIVNSGKPVHVNAYGAIFNFDANGPAVELSGSYGPLVSVSATTAKKISLATSTSEYQTVTALTVNGDVSSWRKGDVVKIISEDSIPEARSYDDPNTTAWLGQFAVVVGVDGSTVNVAGALRDPMITNVRAAKLDKAQSSWSGGVFVQTEAFMSSGNLATNIFRIISLYRPLIQDVAIRQSSNVCFAFIANYAPTGRNLTIDYALDAAAQAPYAYGYGILDRGSEFGLYENIAAGAVRHAFTDDSYRGTSTPLVSGRSYGARIINSIAHGTTSAAFDTHSYGRGHRFENCVAEASWAGFNLRGSNHRIIQCEAKRCTMGLTVSVEGAADASYGHEVDGLQLSSIEKTPLSIAPRRSSTSAKELRTITLRNVSTINCPAKVLWADGATIVADQLRLQVSTPVPNSVINPLLDMRDTSMYIQDMDVDYRSLSGAIGLYLANRAGTAANNRFEAHGVRVRTAPAQADKWRMIVWSSQEADGYLLEARFTHEPRPQGIPYRAGSIVDWVSDDGGTSGRLTITDSTSNNTMSSTMRLTTLPLVVTATLTASRVLYGMPTVPARIGQSMTLINAPTSTGALVVKVNPALVTLLKVGDLAVAAGRVATFIGTPTGWVQTA